MEHLKLLIAFVRMDTVRTKDELLTSLLSIQRELRSEIEKSNRMLEGVLAASDGITLVCKVKSSKECFGQQMFVDSFGLWSDPDCCDMCATNK